MAQITIDLDEQTIDRARHAAEASGLSLSQWIEKMVRLRTTPDWPQEIIDLAGSWSEDDFPPLEELRKQPPDSPREW